MDGIGDQFLAGAALANDEDRAVIGRDMADEFEDFYHLLASSDDIPEMEFIL
jgi:hypothetical protein